MKRAIKDNANKSEECRMKGSGQLGDGCRSFLISLCPLSTSDGQSQGGENTKGEK